MKLPKKRLRDAYQASGEHSKRNFLSWWSRKRSKGKFRFVWTTTLWSSLLLFIPVRLVEYLVDGESDREKWIVSLVFSLLGGLIISLTVWWTNEAKYKNAKIDAHIKTD